MSDEPEPSADVKLFVSNVRYLWKAASVWVFAAMGVIPALLELVPQIGLDQHWEHFVTIALSIVGIFARTVNQAPKAE